ncbi:hypothetical protein K2173_025214 [Erythroxylum novogranatense]|uniref:Uncharacterized protein n=1 Tax=Erythroxylum novogranatense TaxID=1862640 RepID=A0AAV8UGL7_9ROSI|nr:hypothetical protein K2173_025214 [Erythroxylum novogranatense]
MSLESEDRHGPNQQSDRNHELEKKLKIVYTRDFLLSLSDWDVCKKLPSGFEQSLLSEFEDSSVDRFRISGTLSSQTYRRNEYSSSPPTRGELSNYSRVTHGRWDNRSSGRGDRDSDSQSDWDSDSGRRYGNQSRRSRQVPEHDGLLGSGGFPRPAGSAGGSSGTKFRAGDHYQLSKSTEPYQPPRPYKAVPHSRRDTNDSYNDETFGSSDCTSEDQAEEERKRRAAFELMRKEQQKAFQENQKSNPEKSKTGFDISLLLDDPKDDKANLNKNDEFNGPIGQPNSNEESDKSSFPLPAPVSRPLVPPGFSGAIPAKINSTKSLGQHLASELGKKFGDNVSNSKDILMVNRISSNQEEKSDIGEADLSKLQLGSPSGHVSLNDKTENILNLSSALEVSGETGVDGQFYSTYKLMEAFESPEDSELLEPNNGVVGNNPVGESSSAHSNSILEKLFSSAVMLNGSGSSNIVEHGDVKAEDTLSPHNSQSSKFAQWFLDEEKQPVDGDSSTRSADLLSLIVGGEKYGSQVIDAKSTNQIPQKYPFQSPERKRGHMSSNLVPLNAEDVEQSYNTDKAEITPAVLTCEDLEQSIMSEITQNGSTFRLPIQGSSHLDAKPEQQKVDVDDHASQHLLSLLQKPKCPNDTTHSDNPVIGSSDKPLNHGYGSNYSAESDAESAAHPHKPLTLEALFGTAFMKELQPLGGEASGQRNSNGCGRVDVPNSHGLSFHRGGDGQMASVVEVGSRKASYGSSVFASKERQQTKTDVIEKQSSGFDPRDQVEFSLLLKDLGSRHDGSDKSIEVSFPEEDRLVMISGPMNIQNFMPAKNSAKGELLSSSEMISGPMNIQSFMAAKSSAKGELLSSSETTVDISEKLAALNSAFRNERPIARGQDGVPFLRAPYEPRDTDVHLPNLHAQASFSQRHPSQLNHTGPMLRALDSHPTNFNDQMKFTPPVNIIHHDAPSKQFPANMLQPPFPHPDSGMPRIDPAIHNPMIQQIHMPGSFPPPQILRGFPRGAPPPPPAENQVTGFMPGPSPMQTFAQRQPNMGGGFGIPPQGGGANHPEALQRLLEMELRSKQIHPFGSTGHNPGIYGHELDMGSGYR